MTTNVYEQYFEADLESNGVARRGALVMLIADSEAGRIRYEAALTFFPHRDQEDFAVSYDAYYSSVLFDAPGRRSRKREEKLLLSLQDEIDALAEKVGGAIRWEEPLGEAEGTHVVPGVLWT